MLHFSCAAGCVWPGGTSAVPQDLIPSWMGGLASSLMCDNVDWPFTHIHHQHTPYTHTHTNVWMDKFCMKPWCFSLFPRWIWSYNQFYICAFLWSTSRCCSCPETIAFNGITMTLGSLLLRHSSALTVNVFSISQPDCEERFLERSPLVDAEHFQAQDGHNSYFCSGNHPE